MQTDKKTIVIKLTAREATWLYTELEEIRKTNHVSGATTRMLEQAFMARSLQDRIESES